jgi:hypothetical protein
MTTTILLPFRRLLTAVLTTIAFVNSYEHTWHWFAEHGQANAAHWLAAIPELSIILVIVSISLADLSRSQQVILALIGAGAVSVTLTSNLSARGPHAAGAAAALVAPLFAIAGFGLELLGAPLAPERADSAPDAEPEEVEAVQNPEPEPVRFEIIDPPKQKAITATVDPVFEQFKADALKGIVWDADRLISEVGDDLDRGAARSRLSRWRKRIEK